MTREGLEAFVQAFSSALVPVTIEHDPRIPPQGRILSGYVRDREDGESEAVAIMELFEGNGDGEDTTIPGDTRELSIEKYEGHGLTISYDWTHRHEADQADISDIAKILGNAPVHQIKKAVEPISIITLAGTFLAGGIAAGFLNQVGADGWALVKKGLARIFTRKENRKGEQLLIFRALVTLDGVQLEVELILTNPSPEDVEWAFGAGLKLVEKALPAYLANNSDIRRLVFEAAQQEVDLRFAVRKDCRTLVPQSSLRDILTQLDAAGNSSDTASNKN